MRGLNILLVLVVGIFMCGFISAWADNGSLVQYIDGCGELNTSSATYILNTNISNGTNDCLLIKNVSITINGSGFNITGNINASGVGDGANAYTNLVLNNITINGSVVSNGGNSAFGSCGFGGNINITSSNISGAVTSLGGSTNDYGPGGFGGNVTVLDSVVGSVSSNGGNSAFGSCGFGGNINVVVSHIAGSISSIKGIGIVGEGIAGTFNLTNSYIYNSNASVFFSYVNNTTIFDALTLNKNNVTINSISYPEFESLDARIAMNTSGLDLDLTNLFIAKNNISCYDCVITSNTSDEVVFNVTGWSGYRVESLPVINLFLVLNSTSTSRDFIYNVSDDSNIANCSLILVDYDTVNNTNLTAVNKSSNNTISFSPFVVGSYTAYVNCTDSYEFEGQSNIISFEIQAPAVEEVASSGGGSSSSAARSISDSAFTNGFTGNFRTSDSLKFKVNNQTHNITINNISNSSITITVQSIPQIFAMKVGEVLNVDVNYDGVKDIEISYLKYYTSVVSLKVRAIALPYELPVVKNETNVSDVPYGIEDGETDVAEESRSRLFIALSIILFLFFVAIVAMIIYVLMKHNERRKIRALLDRNKRK